MEKTQFLYHYTSIETLALILHSEKIRFNSLKNVNDIQEQEIRINKDIKDFGKYCFVSCWTKSEKESIPHWKMYSSDMKGVRLGLPENMFDTNYDVNEQYCEKSHNKPLLTLKKRPFPRPELLDITYVEDDMLLNPHIVSENNYAAKMNFDGDKIGRYKNDMWSFENESRFRLFTIPMNNTKTYVATNLNHFNEAWSITGRESNINAKQHIDFKLNEIILREMKILIGPKASDAEKIIVESLVNKYKLNSKNIQKSKLRIK